MRFLYLLEFRDTGEGIYFSQVVRAGDPVSAVHLAAAVLIANGNMPEDGDWFDVEVALLLETSGVYANQDAGRFNVARTDGRPDVIALPNRRRPRR